MPRRLAQFARLLKADFRQPKRGRLDSVNRPWPPADLGHQRQHGEQPEHTSPRYRLEAEALAAARERRTTAMDEKQQKVWLG
jgi:hypothetical protein